MRLLLWGPGGVKAYSLLKSEGVRNTTVNLTGEPEKNCTVTFSRFYKPNTEIAEIGCRVPPR